MVEQVYPPALSQDREYRAKSPGLEIQSRGSGDDVLDNLYSTDRPLSAVSIAQYQMSEVLNNLPASWFSAVTWNVPEGLSIAPLISVGFIGEW